jgi:hypothetical protein
MNNRFSGWLANARSPRVMAVFERVVNLVDDRGEVLSLHAPGVPLTAFGVTVTETSAQAFDRLQTGSPVTITPDALVIAGLRLEVDPALAWSPVPNWAHIRDLPASHWDRVAAVVRRVGKPGSALDWPVDRGELRDLARAVQVGCAEALGPITHWLAGRGPGLTPTGDDVLGGALLAAWAGASPHPAAIGALIVAEAGPRTTTLSRAFLQAASQGACGSDWHALFMARDQGELTRAVDRLLAVGHTSGADGLAGFLAVQTVCGAAVGRSFVSC